VCSLTGQVGGFAPAVGTGELRVPLPLLAFFGASLDLSAVGKSLVGTGTAEDAWVRWRAWVGSREQIQVQVLPEALKIETGIDSGSVDPLPERAADNSRTRDGSLARMIEFQGKAWLAAIDATASASASATAGTSAPAGSPAGSHKAKAQVKKRKPLAASSSSVSLGSIAQRLFSLPLNKRPRMSDWRARPLALFQAEYAAMDAWVLAEAAAAIAGEGTF